jgi:hypothetical protein
MFRWLLLLAPALAASSPVAYPEGYRGWNHVKSLVIDPGHALADPFEGIHHVYVNDVGLSALKAGGALPDGTVFAFDLLESPSAEQTRGEGPRKLLGVMVKDARRFSQTGGWGFEAFQGDGQKRLVGDGGASCFACHQSQKATDYVFSRWRG